MYLGLGSNLGDRRRNIRRALVELADSHIAVLKKSPIIETDPVGGPAQPKFLNLVAKARTTLSPHEVLRTIKGIEMHLGRTKTVRNGPRPIDIDILLYGKLRMKTRQLTIPHPRMACRDFVMQPLTHISPRVAQRYRTARKIPDKH